MTDPPVSDSEADVHVQCGWTLCKWEVLVLTNSGRSSVEMPRDGRAVEGEEEAGIAATSNVISLSLGSKKS
jgi:hypothetical protein